MTCDHLIVKLSTLTDLHSDADLRLKRNVFVETALSYVLSYVSVLSPGTIAPTSITILADNDYYSTANTELTQERFHNFNVPLQHAHKTGLGSSAALITALIGATLSFYLPKDQFDLLTDAGKRRLHNLAQAAHCAAQGKVGSGFDIASAVYGSCLYRKFSPTLLESYGEPGTPNFALNLRDLVDELDANTQWDTEIMQNAVKMPKGLRLVMCDVSGGSETPAMVKKVLAWRKSGGEDAEKLLQDLHARGLAVSEELVRLADTSESSPSGSRYTDLAARITDYRSKFKELGDKSDVPIEPPAQTKLLDACTALDGVVGGVTPGSGGYDAVALVLEDRPEVIERLTEMLGTFEFDYQTNEDAAPRISIMRVKQEVQGVREEKQVDLAQWT